MDFFDPSQLFIHVQLSCTQNIDKLASRKCWNINRLSALCKYVRVSVELTLNEADEVVGFSEANGFEMRSAR